MRQKDARIQLGGKNEHRLQAEGIPDVFDTNTQFVHMDCYKKFTMAISVLKGKRKHETQESGEPSVRKKTNNRP